MLMNVQRLHVVSILTVQTLLAHISVNAKQVSKEVVKTVQVRASTEGVRGRLAYRYK